MSNAFENLKRQILADKKKLSLMASLLAVMLLLWGRLLLKQVPRTAIAEPSIAPAAAVDTVEKSDEPVTYAPAPPVRVNLPSVVKRDLFRFDKDRYPQSESEQAVTDPGKSAADSSERDKQRLIEDIRRWVDTLVYQGAILGETPRAMINSRIYSRGDKINGFVITKVMARQVVFERDGIEITLPMSE